jgi:hypothetical protein
MLILTIFLFRKYDHIFHPIYHRKEFNIFNDSGQKFMLLDMLFHLCQTQVISADTGKLLWLGVRNLDCGVCDTTPKGKVPAEHRCTKIPIKYRFGMETDSIVEALIEIEKQHGSVFSDLINDGARWQNKGHQSAGRPRNFRN